MFSQVELGHQFHRQQLAAIDGLRSVAKLRSQPGLHLTKDQLMVAGIPSHDIQLMELIAHIGIQDLVITGH